MAIARASTHVSAGRWPAHEAIGSVTLTSDSRHRRRLRLVSDEGEYILLDLDKAVAMQDGDGLQLEDSRWLSIRAASEAVVEVRHKDSLVLMRLAWHLGNRHVPTEIRGDVLRIRPDHVIENMLLCFGAELRKLLAPLEPEGGAYQHGREGRSVEDDTSQRMNAS